MKTKKEKTDSNAKNKEEAIELLPLEAQQKTFLPAIIPQKNSFGNPEDSDNHVFEEFFNLDYAKSLSAFVLAPLEKYYFRAKFVGFEGDEFPKSSNPQSPMIFASNHSGMSFPWDAIIFSSGLLRLNKFDTSKSARALISPMLADLTLMNPFLIENFWKKAGGIEATSGNFEAMMRHPESHILIYPEGVPGIGKGFNNKYKLQRLSTSSLRMGLKHKADIVPFATINGEYINPFSYTFPFLDGIAQKFGLPFLPLGPMLLFIPFQPWMFYFALPARLVFVRGKKIRPYEMIQKPFEEVTKEDLERLRDEIHIKMQEGLEEAVERYGQSPYDWAGLVASALKHIKKLPFFVPVAWPFLFAEHERRFRIWHASLGSNFEITTGDGKKQKIKTEKKEAKEEDLFELANTALQTVLHNPEVLLLYIPVVGWIPALLRGYSRQGK